MLRNTSFAIVALYTILGLGVLYCIVIASLTDTSSSPSSSFATEVTRQSDRKKRIERQFSIWDGSHRGLTKVIKDAMHDPASYEHVETVYRDAGDHLWVRTTFRGKNGFGGVRRSSIAAKVDVNGKVLEWTSYP